jgi:hypothetical protein
MMSARRPNPRMAFLVILRSPLPVIQLRSCKSVNGSGSISIPREASLRMEYKTKIALSFGIIKATALEKNGRSNSGGLRSPRKWPLAQLSTGLPRGLEDLHETLTLPDPEPIFAP